MAYIRKPVPRKKQAQKEAKPSLNPLALREESEKYKDIGSYKLLDIIGVGGFGIVYRGLHLDTGQTVAVKRVGIMGTPHEELEAIEGEISLLKNLSHPNIVKYYDSLRSNKFLDIVIEFCENGSLLTVMKHLGGKMTEKLCGRYIAQTLKGLNYLHKQGVIHRDIKGANILSTTAGVVKLADFGVATKLNETKKSNSVVGTPYWMAPEIIEMKGQQSSSCDIWSLGCTIIELLTGKPPYFDMPQMAALYHIVTDEHPPLPDGITPVLEDFLRQCFEKDPNRRIDASGLLAHPWLKQALQEELEKARQQAGYTEMIAVPHHHHHASTASAAATTASLGPSGAGSIGPATSPVRGTSTGAGEQQREQREKAGSPFPPGAKPSGTPRAGGGHRLSTSSTGAAPPSTTPAKLPPVATTAAATPAAAKGKKKEEDDDDGSPGLQIRKPQEIVEDIDDLDWGDSDEDEAPKKADAAPALSDSANKVVVEPASVLHAAPKVKPEWIESEDGFDIDLDEDWDIDESVLEKKKQEVAADDDLTAFEIEWGKEAFFVDEQTKINRDIVRQVDDLSTKKPDDTILSACERLAELLGKHVSQTMTILTTRAVIPIMELLEQPSVAVFEAVLTLIQRVMDLDAGNKFQQSLSLVGFVPALVKFGSPGYAIEFRYICAKFIQFFLSKSDFSKKLFISGGGLPVLYFLLNAYDEYASEEAMFRDLIHSTIASVRSVFFFEVPANPRNDFCRLFCKLGLLHPLVGVLRKLAEGQDQSKESLKCAETVGELLVIFGQGDQVVKAHFFRGGILEDMLEVLPRLPQKVLVEVLRTIRLISMDRQSHDLLEAAGAIPALIPYLESPVAENVHQALQALYYVCRLNQDRQEQAALAGIIPPLQRFIRENVAANQFAYPIICWLGIGTARTRAVLQQHEGVQFYIEILANSYWRTHALDALSKWLAEEPGRVSAILSTPVNLEKLITMLKTTERTTQLENILPLLKQMMANSKRLAQALARTPAFMEELKARLLQYSTNNHIRISILETLARVFAACTAPARLVLVLREHDWLPLLDQIARDSSAAVLAPKAEALLQQIRAQLRFELSPDKKAAALAAKAAREEGSQHQNAA